MSCRALLMAVVVSMTTCLLAQQGTRSHLKLVAPLGPLFESLRRANVSGSLEFSGRCGSETSANWPHWRILEASEGSPLQVARETFADDPIIQVTQDADGIVRMIQSGVPTDLLNLRISHVSFWSGGVPSQYAAFSANSAARHAILQTPEVAAYMKGHNIAMPMGEALPGNNSPFPIDSPHVERSMENLTVSQAMDRVLKTFPGIWVYEDCLQPDGKSRFVWFIFFSSRGPGFYIEE
jgi:hypothetical protein